MFQSIRNFFHNVFVGKDELSDVIWNQEYHFHIVHEDEPLTKAELQMLQRIVADAINLEEDYRKLDKMDAQSWVKGSAERDIFFKSVKKHSVKLKKLSALQYRLKHKIAAKG